MSLYRISLQSAEENTIHSFFAFQTEMNFKQF
jgi:hypothetical protein